MKFTSLCNQTIAAGLYKSSYFMNKRIMYKLWFLDFLIFFVPIVIKIPSKLCQNFTIAASFLNINLIVNKKGSCFNFLILNQLKFISTTYINIYQQHLSNQCLKNDLSQAGKCALFPGRCHIFYTTLCDKLCQWP